MISGSLERVPRRTTTSSCANAWLMAPKLDSCTDGMAPCRRKFGMCSAEVVMDEVDSAIVRHLQVDGRLSNRALAERVGIAPSTCLERTRLLHRRGIIQGYKAQVSLRALNRSVQAMVATTIRPLRRDVVAAFEKSVTEL